MNSSGLRPLALLLASLLGLVAGHLHALPVTGLYSHEVPVVGQTEAERQRAFREAFAAVVVKVTGSARWLENPAVGQAMSAAQNLVQEIQYRSENRVPQTPPTVDPVTGQQLPPVPVSQTLMNVVFAPEQIDRLLANAAIPVWDSNRPSVLIWMVLQDDSGQRRLLNSETDAEIVGYIQQFARLRGVPILFPVLDFEDRQNLPADRLWALDAAAITSASQRYGADSILAGRLHLANSGDLVGLWQFIFRDQTLMFDSFNTSLKDYIDEPLDLVTGRLAEHFAIVRADNSQEKVRLQVAGIGSLGAYADLLNFLQGLSVVNSITTSRLEADQLELEVTLVGSRQQLHELIALDRALLPMGSGPMETGAILSYRWTR